MTKLMVKIMNKYIGTFGCGQRNAGRYQIIYAEDRKTACDMMFAKYGREWCMVYDEEEWVEVVEDLKHKGLPVEIPLKNIISQDPDPF